jgi:hypothetical protein
MRPPARFVTGALGDYSPFDALTLATGDQNFMSRTTIACLILTTLLVAIFVIHFTVIPLHT